MEGLAQEMQSYSPEWFENRAFKGLKNIKAGEWDYSDSLLLYLPGTDAAYESVQDAETKYNALVTAPERAYLENIAPSVVRNLPETFDYVDLGPGTEHKEQFIFDAAQEQRKRFIYRPVDISEGYLRLSAEYAAAQGIQTSPLRSSFEELPGKLGLEEKPRFVSIGLTYGNYNPEEILALLKNLMAEKGSAFINAQLHERSNMLAVQEVYTEVAQSMARAKFQLLGLNPDEDIAQVEVTQEVRVWYTLKNSTPKLEAKGIMPGDRLLMLQSLRPTHDSLEIDIQKVFPHYEIFDTGGPFVGVLLKNK